MKCAVAFSVLLAACSASLADSPDRPPSSRTKSTIVLEELVRMTKTGSSDAAVLAYARAHRAELPAELPDSTLQWLRASGVGERVVRYMSAIDVRESASSVPEGVTYADERPDASRRGWVSEDEREGQDETERPAPRDGDDYGDTGTYARYDSDSGGCCGGYGPWYDPFFGYPYLPAPYFSYLFVDRGDFFRRFHDRRDHRGHRDPGFDRGRRSGWRERGGPRDAWRNRGSGERRGGWIAGGPRNPARPRNAGRSFASGGFRGPRGFAPPRARGNSSPGFGGPRGHDMRGSRSPAPFRGSLPRSGGGFRRGSPASSRGPGRH